MILRAAALMLAAILGAPEGDAAPEPVQYAQVTVRQQIIIRVPARPLRGKATPGKPIEWEEKKGPKCVPARAIAGATLLGRNSVDLILRDNSRVRAKLQDSCPALDYYHGFYMAPTEDGMICADRDVIRSRMGGQCEIERFRSLRPVPGD
jgi:hypothetical protein